MERCLIAASVVFPAKSNLAVFQCQQALVGDGHAVRVATEISQDLRWSTEGPLGIDVPLACPQAGEQPLKRAGLSEVGASAMKAEFVVLVSTRQGFQEEPAEQPGQDVDGQKEALATTAPVRAIERQTTARNNAMQMRMMPQGLAPGVQHCQEANLGLEVFRIGSDRAQRFGGGGEENVVDDALILQGQSRELLRQRDRLSQNC
jgi:hypothetical protein